jgi:glycosyl transferase family 87
VGRPGNGSQRQVGGGDPEALLPRNRHNDGRGRLAHLGLAAVIAAAAWLIAFATWSAEPAGYDFVALYAAARLVATGQGSLVTDPAALFAAENAALPAALFDDPIRLTKNLPALAAVMAPLGALPIQAAYAAMLTLSVLALIIAALLLAPLVAREQRARAFAFALLAPTSLIALVEGQTSPFVLLAVAGSLRAPPFWSGALLGLIALRPQLLPLFALVAITERRRATGLVVAAGIVTVVSFLTAGVDGMARFPAILGLAATELRPGELGLAALVRRVISGDDLVLNAALALVIYAIAAAAVFLRSGMFTTRIIDASLWSILAAPHALLHDGVMAYPAIARASVSTRSTALWIGSGLIVALVQQAGVPIAPLWMLALWWFSRRRRQR